MAMASKTSHDSGYKQLFSHPQMVRDLLLGFVPGPWLQRARFDTLERLNASFVSDTQQHRHSDMVWRLQVGPRWVWVYLLLEFQSRPDRWMAVRMMAYLSLLAQNLIQQKQLQQGKLPALIPLVLYNGQAQWAAPTDVNQCFSPSLPGLARFRPRLAYHLVDQTRLQRSPSAEVRNLVEAVFELERSQDFETVGRLIETLRQALQAPGQNELQRTLNAWLRQQISRKAPPELSADLANTLARIPDLIEGTPMLADTMGRLFTEALQKGKKQGRKEGRQEGRDEGAAWMLMQFIEQRFGPIPEWARTRIQSARPDQLVRWGQLILTAPSLESLFEPSDPSH
jgi:predicted transposase/invertase (TIGR01784 family)